MSFIVISRSEFESALPDGAEQGTQGKEYVYDIAVNGKDVALRIYSSIDVRTNQTRDKGADAIRLVYLDKISGKRIGKASRTHRTTGWQARLSKKIQSLKEKTPKIIRCPKCKAVLVKREGQYGPFYSCIGYPDCEFSISIKKLQELKENKKAKKLRKKKATNNLKKPVMKRAKLSPGEAAQAFSKALHKSVNVSSNEALYHEADINLWAPGDSLDFYSIKYPSYNPCQSAVIPFADKDCNVVLAASTSAGKTEVAAMLISEAISRGKKALFASPLKAVTLQKYREWTDEKHPFSKYNTSIVTGDFRLTKARKKELEQADIILLTSEMVDSKTRLFYSESNYWLQEAGVLVYDEAHLITKLGRGDAVEVGLMRFSMLNPTARILFLSATMPNIAELGLWLSRLNGKESNVVRCDWRPCQLNLHFVAYPELTGRGSYYPNEETKRNLAVQIAKQHKGDPFIIFVHSKTAGHALLKALKEEGFRADFHRADLNVDQKEQIEKDLDSGEIEIIVSTPTLAWGVNLSARRVIILGIHRGLSVIDDLGIEINQMAGRAGRVGLQPEGDSYILLPSSEETPELFEQRKNEIINVAPITSRLLDEDTLAFHITAEIAQGGINKLEDIHTWYNRSFSALQQTIDADKIAELSEKLMMRNIIQKDEDNPEEIKASILGKISSWLYYNPFDIADWASNFKRIFERGRETDDYCLAWALSNIHTERKREYVARDLQPTAGEVELNIRSKLFDGQYMSIGMTGQAAAIYFLILGDHRMPNAVQGESRSYRYDSERVCAALNILDKYIVQQGGKPYWDAVKLRITHGVGWKETELMKGDGVGPVRARRLVDGGVRTISDFMERKKDAARLIGVKAWQKAAKSFRKLGFE